jgi:hypothetical protein
MEQMRHNICPKLSSALAPTVWGKLDRRQTMGCPQTNNGQYNCDETLILNPTSVLMKLTADQILKIFPAF